MSTPDSPTMLLVAARQPRRWHRLAACLPAALPDRARHDWRWRLAALPSGEARVAAARAEARLLDDDVAGLIVALRPGASWSLNA